MSNNTNEKPDYVLGTHDQEHARLGLQHSLWRDLVMDAWRRAGICAGSRVVDIGAGPGFATVDLADMVGATGRVTAVEISKKFVHAIEQLVRARALGNVDAHEVDLMRERIPHGDGAFDAAWCRWVCMFVANVPALVQRIHESLRAGGVVVFHEYSHYQTYGLQPASDAIDSFVTHAMESFRASGGHANIAGTVLTQLGKTGFEIVAVKPILRAARPHEPLWQWPAGFIRTYVPRLVQLGQVSDAWAENVLTALSKAEHNSQSIMLTPTVLEIIARKK